MRRDQERDGGNDLDDVNAPDRRVESSAQVAVESFVSIMYMSNKKVRLRCVIVALREHDE